MILNMVATLYDTVHYSKKMILNTSS